MSFALMQKRMRKRKDGAAAFARCQTTHLLVKFLCANALNYLSSLSAAKASSTKFAVLANSKLFSLASPKRLLFEKLSGGLMALDRFVPLCLLFCAAVDFYLIEALSCLFSCGKSILLYALIKVNSADFTAM